MFTITTNNNTGERFEFSFGGSVALTKEEIWPDGNMPKKPTSEDVVKTIGKYNSIGRFLKDWNLEDCISLNIKGVK
ncbi:MAG: hypothetical protein KAX49_15310 [Halanaerobiales bacterium]|nr:hypothetical protein [Halanaerobiales bacterium]